MCKKQDKCDSYQTDDKNVNYWLNGMWLSARTCGGHDRKKNRHFESWKRKKLTKKEAKKNQLHTRKRFARCANEINSNCSNASAMCMWRCTDGAQMYICKQYVESRHLAHFFGQLRHWLGFCSLYLLARVDGHSTKLHDKRVKFFNCSFRKSKKFI